jgi:hypothetical protein
MAMLRLPCRYIIGSVEWRSVGRRQWGLLYLCRQRSSRPPSATQAAVCSSKRYSLAQRRLLRAERRDVAWWANGLVGFGAGNALGDPTPTFWRSIGPSAESRGLWCCTSRHRRSFTPHARLNNNRLSSPQPSTVGAACQTPALRNTAQTILPPHISMSSS